MCVYTEVFAQNISTLCLCREQSLKSFYIFAIVVRLYDINTFQCFVSANAKDQHSGPITAVSFVC